MGNPFPGIDPYLEAQGYWGEFHLKFLNYCQEAINDILPDAYEARIDERLVRIEEPGPGATAMSNPFPGVDPYLEAQGYCPDFHNTFLTTCREAVADGLPDAYEARIDDRMNLVDLAAGEAYQVRPDVAILRDEDRRGRSGGAPPGGVATIEPVTLPIMMFDADHQGYIEILHRKGRTLVTVIELLSPSNKLGRGYDDYVFRRNQLLRQDVNLVELDFLIDGRRPPVGGPLPPGDCYATVAPLARHPECDVYAWSIRRPLPTIPIPLRAPDPDIPLDLAAVYTLAYDRGRYARSIRRERPLVLSLADEDRAWAEGLARG